MYFWLQLVSDMDTRELLDDLQMTALASQGKGKAIQEQVKKLRQQLGE